METEAVKNIRRILGRDSKLGFTPGKCCGEYFHIMTLTPVCLHHGQIRMDVTPHENLGNLKLRLFIIGKMFITSLHIHIHITLYLDNIVM